MIGIVYHVVHKDTGRVVKVGSTIRSLKVRFRQPDYKNRYKNYFLKEVKRIESNDLDVYDPEDSFCPFLWHLAAAEHVEMVRQNTYRIGVLSNQFSPLWQKCIGFDAAEASKVAGSLGAKISVEKKLGIHSADFDRVSSGRKGGLANVESGHLQKISSLGGKACGPVVGKRNAESGWMKKVQQMGLGKGGKIGGPKGMHTRWHTNRGIVSSNCKFCKAD